MLKLSFAFSLGQGVGGLSKWLAAISMSIKNEGVLMGWLRLHAELCLLARTGVFFARNLTGLKALHRAALHFSLECEVVYD